MVRFYELCGSPTYFLKEGLLETWDKAVEKMSCEETKEVEFGESDLPF
ncbi:MAG: hypothetical protein H0Z40_11325 [Desulfotomaculum sp.]|nr:hypothetical protein [Desulfotomaculum sp.]